MKIAFVNQPIDSMLPPYQSSVGACTFGLASALATSCEVVAYGLKEKQQVDVAPEVTERGVRYLFLPNSLSDRLLNQASRRSPQIIRFAGPPSVSSLQYPVFGKNVAELIRQEGCDLIHVQHSSQYLPILREKNPNAKLVLHLHAELFSQMLTNLPKMNARLQCADLITSVSDHITARMRRDFPDIADRCATAYNGIEADDFQAEKDYQTLAQRPVKRILCTGAVSPHKGHHVLLEAFKKVVQRYPQVHLDIVGSQVTYPFEETFDLNDVASREIANSLKAAIARAGSYVAFLRAQFTPEIADRVTFHGMVPRSSLLEHYRNADVFAFTPVWDEGFGIPPVEAMAAGTPVVASRSGGVAETVLDQQTGFLCHKHAVSDTAEAILKLLESDSLREKMGRAGRAHVLKNLTWKAVGEGVLHRYQKLQRITTTHCAA
jgi:glycosyltransferase involved in cell wall biosynthesis